MKKGAAVPLQVFPVESSGKPNYGDTFNARRAAGPHGGIDIFAPEGTPVLAVDDGTVQHATNKLGGTVARLLTSDGTVYYYAHLSGYVGEPRAVRAGEPIGYVGRTGNAKTTPPHLHFGEYPPGQGVGPVNPYDELRAAQGLATVPRVDPKPGKPARGNVDGMAVLLLLYLLSRRG